MPCGDDKATLKVWGSFEDLVTKGKAKAAGVSQFNLAQLKALVAAAKIPPILNQIQMSVVDGASLKDARDAQELGVRYWAYTSLGKNAAALKDTTVQRIADTHGVPSAWIAFKFLTQQGFPVLTFAGLKTDRVKEETSESFNALTLSDDELADLTERKAA